MIESGRRKPVFMSIDFRNWEMKTTSASLTIRFRLSLITINMVHGLIWNIIAEFGIARGFTGEMNDFYFSCNSTMAT